MEMGMKIDLPPQASEPKEGARTVPDGDPMVEIDHLRFYYGGKEAVKDAKPLSQNGYKVRLAQVAVKRAILIAAGKPKYWEL